MTEIYTVILKRVFKYANSETKKELTQILIKEFIENHNNQEPFHLDLDEQTSAHPPTEQNWAGAACLCRVSVPECIADNVCRQGNDQF